jgi:hypothetical protein
MLVNSTAAPKPKFSKMPKTEAIFSKYGQRIRGIVKTKEDATALTDDGRLVRIPAGSAISDAGSFGHDARVYADVVRVKLMATNREISFLA